MKRILVVGGYGVLGFHLINYLRNNFDYDFGIVDNRETWDFIDIIDSPPTTRLLGFDFKSAFIQFKPDVVINLAEIVDPEPSLCEFSAHTNVTFATQVTFVCSASGVRCITPSWYEFTDNFTFEDNIWARTVVWRGKLYSAFNKGNSVNNTIYLPRIISPLYTENVYGNLVKRVYNSITFGKPLITYHNEISDYPGIVNDVGNLIKTERPWCSYSFACKKIEEQIRIRSRNPFMFSGNLISAHTIIAYVLHKFGVESIAVHKPNGHPSIIRTKEFIESFNKGQIKKLSKTIDEVLNEWEEEREYGRHYRYRSI